MKKCVCAGGQAPTLRNTTTKKGCCLHYPGRGRLEPGPGAYGGGRPHFLQCPQAGGSGPGQARPTWPSTMPASSRVISGWVSSSRPSWLPIFQRRDSRCTARSFFNSDSTKPESQRNGHGAGRRWRGNLSAMEGRRDGSGSPGLIPALCSPWSPPALALTFPLPGAGRITTSPPP